jgi:hypothetical protein
MKLQVRTILDAASPSGAVLMLCDEAGKPLPQQEACEVRCQAAALNTVRVTFVIDSETIAMATDAQPSPAAEA